MEFLTEYGLFLAKAVTLVICLVVIAGIIVAAGQKTHKPRHGHIEITPLNDLYKQMSDALRNAVMDHAQVKKLVKEENKKTKKEKAEQKKAGKKTDGDAAPRKRVFVINFDGDIKASATEELREEITAVLSQAQTSDEVVLRLESTGGMVHSYGLAASQLCRITGKSIPLTVCVDKVAASGGYMMACVASKILAAPFAIIGSIGVVGQLPNFHRLLKKNDIDFEMQTAGEFKRTLTIFAENTDKAREKFAEELEETHQLFKDFIHDNRDGLDVDSVATGETWYGTRALDKHLIDAIQTSDEYLTSQSGDADIYEVRYIQKKSIPEKFGIASQQAMDRVLLNWWERLSQSRFFS